MGDTLDIRPFEPADLPALHSICRAAFAPTFRSFRELVGEKIASVAFKSAEAEQAALLDQIAASNSGHEIWVAVRDSSPVGFVSLRVDSAGLGEITLNAVQPDHAGVGIGSELYKRAIGRMRALGASAATVGVGGDPSHAGRGAPIRKRGSGRPFRRSGSIARSRFARRFGATILVWRFGHPKCLEVTHAVLIRLNGDRRGTP
jgi:ribosomal protein S18 acetylase RimI-like enzyme